jgi:hypothetical protein
MLLFIVEGVLMVLGLEVIRCVVVYVLDGPRYPRVVLYRCLGHELWVPGLPQLRLWLQKKKSD